jgi:RNA polymerase sigma-70 factor (ECF subfamily)
MFSVADTIRDTGRHAMPATQVYADESELVARLRAGDDGAYAHLVTTYGPRMLAVARRYLHEENDANDALQDAFLSVFKAIGRFEGNSALSTWLHSIVVRACLMKLRTYRSREHTSIEELLPKFEGNFDHRVNPRPPWRGTVEDNAESREVRELVRKGIDQLPEIYRVVLLLRDIEGMDTQETADLLGLTATVIKTRLHRARQALRGLLDPHLAQDAR